MRWFQRPLVLPSFTRGFHLITGRIVSELPELAEIRVGMLNVFIQHTSASLTINENASPEVRADLESTLNAIVREDFPYEHSLEGPDDMPAHIKAAMLGMSLMIPIAEGQLALGIWQGIYLCEHRNQGGRRRLMLTLWGE
jgi:secondary thiamine-phosphate synthase enzyme